MHANNIELLSKEAQRLLRLNIEGLDEMMKAKGVITDSKEIQQTFDNESTPKYIQLLQGELAKIEKLELVIAIVGTMKAGKSTTINAIVGTEVLPNRNRPMTALPTLIRHTSGQIEPLLKFENNQPINNLFEEIRVKTSSGKLNIILEKLSQDPDMMELIDNIKNKRDFRKNYQGAEDIFWCLKTLNDLVRLSSELHVEFPFSSYSNVDQMPVINVEFAHLRKAGHTQGQLTLLDTPGPNEAGQNHLRHMLSDQLKKSSAIFAVFDYTQLKSDADEQVREEIKKHAVSHKGRLFALVNKFDQKDRNGDGKEAVQALVADNLMSGLIEKKHVFPVSSKWGYLANRARHEITINKRLPEHNQASWVVDFAEEALGRRWENKLSDVGAVLDSANALWIDSGFQEPMENVLRVAHANAALFAMDSTAEKLIKCATDIENFLGIRKGALSQSTEKLRQRIEALKKDITDIEKMQSSTEAYINKIFDTLNSQIGKKLVSTQNSITDSLTQYFKEGKIAEKQDFDSKKEQMHGNPAKVGGISLGSIFGSKTTQEIRDFDPNKKLIKFSNKSDAYEFIKKIQNSCEDTLNTSHQDISHNTDEALSKFYNDFLVQTNKIKMVISRLNETMCKEGFNINIKIPETKNLYQTLRKNEFLLTKEIDHKTRTEYYSAKKSDWWSGVKNFINDDWGREKRSKEVDEYHVDMTVLQNSVNNTLGKFFPSLMEKMNTEITLPLNNQVSIFFKELEKNIEDIRGNLNQGIKDQQKGQRELNELKISLDHFIRKNSNIIKDSDALRKDLNDLDKTSDMSPKNANDLHNKASDTQRHLEVAELA